MIQISRTLVIIFVRVKMNRIFRWGMVVVGCVAILYAAGFFLQATWATLIWPVKSARLSNIFISSIFAAIGAPIIWIGLANEAHAMVGGALNLLVTNAGFAVSIFNLYSHNPQPPLLIFGVISSLVFVICIGLVIYASRKAFRDNHRLPAVVRVSFIGFSATLLVTSIALLARRPNIFPWPLVGENSVLYGAIFLGAMWYFLYGVAYPVWSNARGQMIGFLAYDLVLIVPFVIHFQDVRPEMLTSLIIYTTVVSYSGILAAYYLFIHPATRFSFARKANISQERYEKTTTD
jgi:hypothetical protein